VNILQIAPPWIDTPPIKGYGGTEWVIYNLIKGLTSLDHDVTLFATKRSRSPGPVKYVFTKSFVDQNLPWEASLPSLLHYHQAFRLARQFDLVHAHLSSQTDIIILPFLADLAEAGIPAVATIHGHHPFDRFTFSDKYYHRYYASKVNVINISAAMDRVCPPGFTKVGVVHNSLDLSQIKFQSKKGKYLTWLGKIVPDKGTHHAILAAKDAGEQFVFAGLVDKFQKPSRDYFNDVIRPLIDGNQVIYLGPADAKLKNRLLRGAKGFLNPINWMEPFGMVMIEALAAGTPVISYARGAANELIKNGQTGFLVTTRSQMVDAIPHLSGISRKRCRDYVEQYFSPIVAAQNHLAIYSQLITASRLPAPARRRIPATPTPWLNQAWPQLQVSPPQS